MSKFRDALRKKFKTPREAILALGLDESLLTERAYDSVNPLIKEKTMQKIKLSALGTVAYGALTTFLRPQLAMDAKIDLTKGLRNITAKNFTVKRPVLAAWINATVEGHLDPQFAQDGALNSKGLDAVLDMIELAKDDFPDEMKKEEKKPDAKDEDMDDSDMDAEDDAETDEEKAMRMKKRADDKKAKDKKAKDKKMGKDGKPMAGAKDKAKDEDVNEEDEEHDPDTAKETANDEDAETAMDEKIHAGIEAGIKKERDRMEAIAVAKDHVRSRVGNLPSMAFDSAAQVFSKAIEIASGKKPPKDANVDMLKFAFDNLPSKEGTNKRTYAFDSAPSTATGDIAKRSPTLAKNLERIGHQ